MNNINVNASVSHRNYVESEGSDQSGAQGNFQLHKISTDDGKFVNLSGADSSIQISAARKDNGADLGTLSLERLPPHKLTLAIHAILKGSALPKVVDEHGIRHPDDIRMLNNAARIGESRARANNHR